MMLYRICVKTTPNGFNIHTQEILSPYLWDACCESEFNVNKTDRILTGSLYSYDSQLVVYTYDRAKIESYITEMIEILQTYLKQKLDYFTCLVEQCK